MIVTAGGVKHASVREAHAEHEEVSVWREESEVDSREGLHGGLAK